MYMGVWVCLCTCECMYQRTPEKWVGHPNAAVTGGCELPTLDAGNWTWMLCKGGSHSQPRAISQVHNRGFSCDGICVSMATQMALLLFYNFFLESVQYRRATVSTHSRPCFPLIMHLSTSLSFYCDPSLDVRMA